MKKTFCLVLGFVATFSAHAQSSIFGNTGQKMQQEFEALWVIMPVLWIVGAGISYGKTMTGGDKDVKSFLGGLGVTTGGVLAIAAAYKFVSGVTI